MDDLISRFKKEHQSSSSSTLIPQPLLLKHLLHSGSGFKINLDKGLMQKRYLLLIREGRGEQEGRERREIEDLQYE